jgi:drug/metabolite transporter (DMT)-like permease
VSPESNRAPTLAVAGGLAIVYVVWGSTYLGIALSIETLPPLLMASTRFLVAGALLYGLARLTSARGEARPGRREWTAAFLTGGPMLAGGNGAVVWAQQTVSSGIAALVIASVALWIVLLDRLFFGRRLGWPALAGLAAGFGGVALLVNPSGNGGVDPTGATILVLGALAWAIGSLLARGGGLPSNLLVAASLQMLAGGFVLALAGAVAGELSDVHPSEVSLRSLGGLAYLIVFGSIVAFSAYGWLLRVARTSLVATYAYVNPVVAVWLGWAFLGEGVSGRTLLAGGVIVASVALIVSSRRSPASKREPVPLPAPAATRQAA